MGDEEEEKKKEEVAEKKETDFILVKISDRGLVFQSALANIRHQKM